ncbi:RNA helicase domain-containing protein [Candidatus Saccharibacteria bacterium]|nr:RNA helicase domain-containing protein [Candidatus Saccharibacteria bacterium]
MSEKEQTEPIEHETDISDIAAAELAINAFKNQPEITNDDIERQEKLKNGVKVVIVGPSHSGKSVFTHELRHHLDTDKLYVFSATRDGEGVWFQDGYNRPEVREKRQKDTDNQTPPEFVEYARQAINDWVGPLMLIDIGGLTTDENARIIDGATHAIILSNDLSKIDEWSKFVGQHGIDVIAKLHSNYDSADDLQLDKVKTNQLVGSVHHLERGVHDIDHSTIQILAGHLMDVVDNNKAYQESHGDNEENHFIINLPNWMVDVPHQTFEKTIKRLDTTGKLHEQTVANRRTLFSAVPVLYDKIKTDFSDGQPVWLNGSAGAFVVATLALGLTEAGCPDVRLNSLDGYIKVEKLGQSTDYDKNKWSVEQSGSLAEQPVYFIDEKTNKNKPFKPKDLPSYKIPEVSKDSVVIVSTAGPNWLRSSIALGYKDHVSAIAAYVLGEDGGKSVIVWSKDKSILGKTVEELQKQSH